MKLSRNDILDLCLLSDDTDLYKIYKRNKVLITNIIYDKALMITKRAHLRYKLKTIRFFI